MIHLTKKQSDTLKFIKKFKEKNDYMPSFQQMAVKFGVSKQAVSDRLDALENKGYIEREYGIARAIRILED